MGGVGSAEVDETDSAGANVVGTAEAVDFAELRGSCSAVGEDVDSADACDFDCFAVDSAEGNEVVGFAADTFDVVVVVGAAAEANEIGGSAVEIEAFGIGLFEISSTQHQTVHSHYMHGMRQ